MKFVLGIGGGAGGRFREEMVCWTLCSIPLGRELSDSQLNYEALGRKIC